MITPEHVRAIVMKELKAAHLPMSLTFFDAGMTSNQMQRIQREFTRLFNRTVSIVLYSDTVYTLTERLNQQNFKRSA